MRLCVGILGKLFGHNFKSFIINYGSKGNIELGHFKTSVYGFEKMMDKIIPKDYEVRCKRCGILCKETE